MLLIINILNRFISNFPDKIEANVENSLISEEIIGIFLIYLPVFGFYFSTPSFTTSPTWTFSWTLIKFGSIMAIRSAMAL